MLGTAQRLEIRCSLAQAIPPPRCRLHLASISTITHDHHAAAVTAITAATAMAAHGHSHCRYLC
jgi:hypothetical protein